MNYTCNLEIPEEIIKKLGIREQEISSAFRNELAAFFFEKKLLSFAIFISRVHIPRWLLHILESAKISRPFDQEPSEKHLVLIEP